MKNKIIIILIIVISCISIWLTIASILRYQVNASTRALLKSRNQAIANIIDSRRIKNAEKTTVNPFSDEDVVRVLFIGLDTRVGQEAGHCDVIQLISIDTKNTGNITITAVPRGTYSPLPPGKGTIPSDYYISNACDLGGLEYGIQQIEKILGVKSDYLAVVGFSETLGILRYLHLPTTETLQWLRNRHGYSIGEPQRAHNHSTFIKQMLVKFVPVKQTTIDTGLQYIIYNLIKTDLSFSQTKKIINAVSAMDIAEHPEKIKLSMRPFYLVQDISYDQDNITKYLEETLSPIAKLLSKDDYSDISEEMAQTELFNIIEKNKDNSEFISWAYQNNLWLQIENRNQSLSVQFDLLTAYLLSLPSDSDRQSVLTDYILEMENRAESIWQNKGKDLLTLKI